MDGRISELRHAIRGAMNALKLCTSAFEVPLELAEKLEFLDDIERSAAKITTLLDEFDAVTASEPPVQADS